MIAEMQPLEEISLSPAQGMFGMRTKSLLPSFLLEGSSFGADEYTQCTTELSQFEDETG